MKLKIFLLLPLIVIPLTLFIPTIKFFFRKLSKRFLFYIIYLIVIYTLFIVLYNTLLSISLDSILCKTFQNGKKRSLLDYSIPCEDESDNFSFSIIGLLLYGFLVPFIIITGLIKNRKRLSKISVLFKYGFLYTEYHNKYFYWEIVRFSVKVLLLIISKVFLT